MNQFQCIGRLTRDPEVRALGGNNTVANLSIAINRRWLERASNQWKEQVLFMKAVAWGYAAERAANLRKGAQIFAVGHLEQETWTDKEGNERNNIVLKIGQIESIADLRAKKSDEGFSRPQSGGDDFTDEIPF